jgi:hypothetical protein
MSKVYLLSLFRTCTARSPPAQVCRTLQGFDKSQSIRPGALLPSCPPKRSTPAPASFHVAGSPAHTRSQPHQTAHTSTITHLAHGVRCGGAGEELRDPDVLKRQPPPPTAFAPLAPRLQLPVACGCLATCTVTVRRNVRQQACAAAKGFFVSDVDGEGAVQQLERERRREVGKGRGRPGASAPPAAGSTRTTTTVVTTGTGTCRTSARALLLLGGQAGGERERCAGEAVGNGLPHEEVVRVGEGALACVGSTNALQLRVLPSDRLLTVQACSATDASSKLQQCHCCSQERPPGVRPHVGGVSN